MKQAKRFYYVSLGEKFADKIESMEQEFLHSYILRRVLLMVLLHFDVLMISHLNLSQFWLSPNGLVLCSFISTFASVLSPG